MRFLASLPLVALGAVSVSGRALPGYGVPDVDVDADADAKVHADVAPIVDLFALAKAGVDIEARGYPEPDYGDILDELDIDLNTDVSAHGNIGVEARAAPDYETPTYLEEAYDDFLDKVDVDVCAKAKAGVDVEARGYPYFEPDLVDIDLDADASVKADVADDVKVKSDAVVGANIDVRARFGPGPVQPVGPATAPASDAAIDSILGIMGNLNTSIQPHIAGIQSIITQVTVDGEGDAVAVIEPHLSAIASLTQGAAVQVDNQVVPDISSSTDADAPSLSSSLDLVKAILDLVSAIIGLVSAIAKLGGNESSVTPVGGSLTNLTASIASAAPGLQTMVAQDPAAPSLAARASELGFEQLANFLKGL